MTHWDTMDLTNFDPQSDGDDIDRQIYCGFAFLPGEYENIFSSDDDDSNDLASTVCDRLKVGQTTYQ